MSAELINKVKKARVGNPTAKAILFYLADCTTGHGCFPSQKTIAADLELSGRTVIRQLEYLEKKGFISRRFVYQTGSSNKTFYAVLGDAVAPKMDDIVSPKMGDTDDKWVTNETEMGDKRDSAYKVGNDKVTTSKKSKRRAPLSVEELTTVWEADEFYTGIDIPEEIRKMHRWLAKNPHRKFTQKFAENWLDKADRVLPTNGNGHKGPGCPECADSPITAKGFLLDPETRRAIPCKCRKNGSA